MPNFANKIVDIVTGLAVRLERAKAGQIREINGRLNALGRSIISIIQRNERTLTGPHSTPSRRDGVYSQATGIITETYAGIRRGWPGTLARISTWYVERAANDINRAAGVPLFKRLTDKQIQAIANDVLIEGAPSRDWWSKQSATLRDRFVREMRQGVALNETVDQLVRRINGTPAAGFADGLTGGSKRNAESLVRTSVQAASEEARLKQYEASPAVKVLMHLSTFDLRTSLICIARSNLQWDKETKNPIGGHNKKFMRPPLHFRCRSTLIGVTKSAAELEKMGFKLPPGTRASMDGQIPNETTFSDFLKTKTEDEQRELLGPARQKLWKEGKITMSQLINQNDRPLTLDELT